MYLTDKAGGGLSLEILLPQDLIDDSLSTALTDAGWLYAEFHFTKARVLVRPTQSKRFLKAWNAWVTDFEVREIETGVLQTTVDSFALVTKLGGPKKLKLFTHHEVLSLKRYFGR
jgi:hypothetical protein